MYFVSIAAKNLARRPTRTSLTGLGVAVAVASLIMLVGLARGLEGAWSQSLLDRGVHLLASQKSAVEVLAGAVDEDLSATLTRRPEVTAAAGEMVALMPLEGDRTVLASGWPPEAFLWDSLNLISGQLPGSGDDVVLGESLAASMKLGLGGELPLMGRSFKVSGVSRNQSALSQGAVFMPLHSLQDLVSKPGVVTFLNLRLAEDMDQAETDSLVDALSLEHPELRFLPTGEVTRQNRILGISRAKAWGTSLLAILISMVFVLNTMVMSVSERTREIGILAAVGWSRARIIWMVLLEGIILCLGGGLAGMGLGLVGMETLTSHSELGSFIQPNIDLYFLVEAGAAAVLLGGAGSLYPAWRAVNLQTALALKRE